MNPDTLQTFGVLAIGLGFVLIGLGGFATYHSSQVVQHQSEMRQVEQKGEMNAQILTLMMRNQELANQELVRAQQAVAAAQQPATPPAPAYYRPPSPPPPNISSAPPPIAEAPQPPPAAEPYVPPDAQPYAEGPQQTAPPAAISEPQVTPITPIIPGAPAVTRNPSDWEEPDSFAPQESGRYLTVHQQHVIADTLRAHGRHVVTIESSYGDPVSREFAEELAKAFTEANWQVSGITEHQGLPLASGVTVSAASFPPAPETRAMYEALLSAGIAVTQQLNPKQHNGETVVLVGTPL